MKAKAEPSVMVPIWDELDEISYCINCRDMGSELYGTFAYDEDLFPDAGMWAVSPVFEDVESFYDWARSKGFRYHDLNSMFKLRKTFM